MSDKEEKPKIIIIKRITKKSGHHGGGWKIAYADFMTAMMAFFMLMWMLGMLNKSQLQGISNYFKKPMKDLFIDNQLHNTTIPKVATEHSEKNEFAPIYTNKDGRSALKSQLQPTSKSEPDVAKTDSEGKALSNASSKDSRTPSTEIPKQRPQKESLNEKLQIKMTDDKAQGGPAKNMTPQEKVELEKLKSNLEASMKLNPKIKELQEHLNFKVVADGLKIEITSLKNKPMFSSGKTDFSKYTSDIIGWLATELNKTPRKITIIGHTDTEPYAQSNKYTNWELSTDRANATRRYLIQNKIAPDKIIRVQGTGSTNLLIKDNGANPANRRIEIIVLSDEATKRMAN